ncbi:hypothetical protein [Methanococcoides sp. FTZ1]|uniref:hypothetical protein n=1 Tax=Methanococcoides sp. FTZ1 TaxID=3439061 RepID=UPI003F841FF5
MAISDQGQEHPGKVACYIRKGLFEKHSQYLTVYTGLSLRRSDPEAGLRDGDSFPVYRKWTVRQEMIRGGCQKASGDINDTR